MFYHTALFFPNSGFRRQGVLAGAWQQVLSLPVLLRIGKSASISTCNYWRRSTSSAMLPWALLFDLTCQYVADICVWQTAGIRDGPGLRAQLQHPQCSEMCWEQLNLTVVRTWLFTPHFAFNSFHRWFLYQKEKTLIQRKCSCRALSLGLLWV